MMFVPEIKLKTTLDLFLSRVKQDLIDNELTPEKSWLKRMCPDIMIGEYSFFDQGKQIINQSIDDPRLLKVDYMYNMRMDRFPTMFIHTGSQSHSMNAMAMGIGHFDKEYIQTSGDPDSIEGTYDEQDVYARRMGGTLNVIIMSDNSNEVLFLYYLVQAGLIALLPHLAMSGFENIKMNGQDLLILEEVVPKNTYKRVVQLNFEYVTGAIELTKILNIKDIELILEKIYEK